MGGHTVIGVIQEALKEEKAREEETETEVLRRRETRKSLNRRVSFASHATIRYSPLFLFYFHVNGRLFPQAGTPTGTPSPKKGVGFAFENGSPSTDNDSTAEYSPQPTPRMDPHTPSPTESPPRMGFAKNVTSPPGSDSEDTSMDIADDNLTLPLPSALIKSQLQRGVGFLVDDEGGESEEEMDMTQPFVSGGIIPSRDGVNRFLNSEDDQTMEFTRIYPSQNKQDEQDDTMGMEFTRVVGKIQGLKIPTALDKENRPPVDDEDGATPP